MTSTSSFPKLSSLQLIAETGTVLIVRLDDAELAYDVSKAAVAGGVTALEIPLTVPSALEVIRRLATEHRADDVVVGAGTVLDGYAAHAAVSAGARMLVSPQLDPDMIAVANRYQAVAISGAYTPTEIVNTVSAGADMVKLFPAEFLGPDYVRTVLAPLAGIPLAPTGGVNPDNVKEWFTAGVAAVGVGSFVTKAGGLERDLSRVTEAAEIFLASVRDARG